MMLKAKGWSRVSWTCVSCLNLCVCVDRTVLCMSLITLALCWVCHDKHIRRLALWLQAFLTGNFTILTIINKYFHLALSLNPVKLRSGLGRVNGSNGSLEMSPIEPLSQLFPSDSPILLPPSSFDLYCLFGLFPKRGSVFKQIIALIMISLCVCVLMPGWFVNANWLRLTDGRG